MSRLALSKTALRRLEWIVKETEAKVVVSSTWRNHPEAYSKLLTVLKYRDIYVAGRTPTNHELGNTHRRGSEIWEWTEKYFKDTNKERENFRYAILDDSRDFYDWQFPFHFWTDMDYGLTDNIAYRVAYHLNQSDDFVLSLDEFKKLSRSERNDKYKDHVALESNL